MDIRKDLEKYITKLTSLENADKLVAAFICGLEVGTETSLENEQTAAG